MADTDNFPLTGDPTLDTPDIDGTEAGASGTSSGGVHISQGALIAIIIVVVVVALAGIATSALFFIAKKREWTMKETLRRSARKVVTALTPRRTEFPRSVKEPPTPRIPPEHSDLEKGVVKGKEKKKEGRK